MPNFHYFHFYKDENDGGGFGKNCSSRFQATTICLVGVHRSVGFAHDNDS